MQSIARQNTYIQMIVNNKTETEKQRGQCGESEENNWEENNRQWKSKQRRKKRKCQL